MARDVVVLYSGGIDSSYLVTLLDGKYERIRLVTYRVPYAVNEGRPAGNADQLRRICTQSIIEHDVIDLRPTIERIRGGLLQVERDNRACGFAYAWCLGCKLSMHVRTVLYARSHGITEVADGNKGNDAHALEQTREFIDLLTGLYARYGITYGCPGYDEYDAPTAPMFLRKLVLVDDNTRGRRELLRRGFRIPPTILNQDRLNQPFCPVSFSLNVLRLFRPESDGAATRYFRLKEPVVDALIREAGSPAGAS